MRVAAQQENGWLTFTFDPAVEELHPDRAVTMTGRSARFQLPDGVRRELIHPDLEALAAYLIVHPFVDHAVTFDRPISPAFRRALARTWGHESRSVDESLSARPRPLQGRPALAFSGGTDSTAAMAILPESTVAVYCERVDPPWVTPKGRFRAEAALAACAAISDLGRDVRVVPTDFEHVRSPVGFPTIWSNAAGAVLLADEIQADAMSWGIIAESAYGVGGYAFVDWAGRPVNDQWADIFATVQLPFLQAVVGVSEVGTTRIVRASPFAGIPTSCVRGDAGTPCGRCVKCFRKSLLDLAVSGGSPSDADLDRFFLMPDVRSTVGKFPIKHEDVIAYIAATYRGSQPLMSLLRRRVRADILDLAWLDHWYRPSAAMLPESYRDEITANLDAVLGGMSPDQEIQMRAWDLRPMLEDPRYRDMHDAIVTALDRNVARQRSLLMRARRLPRRAARALRRLQNSR